MRLLIILLLTLNTQSYGCIKKSCDDSIKYAMEKQKTIITKNLNYLSSSISTMRMKNERIVKLKILRLAELDKRLVREAILLNLSKKKNHIKKTNRGKGSNNGY